MAVTFSKFQLLSWHEIRCKCVQSLLRLNIYRHKYKHDFIIFVKLKKHIKNTTKKSSNEKKYTFTLVANTKDVRVSTYNTTLKRVYEYLMTTIKERPDDVIESLKNKQFITVPNPTIKIEPDHVPVQGETDTALKQKNGRKQEQGVSG